MRAAVALTLAFAFAAAARADDKPSLKSVEGDCALVSFEGKGLKGTRVETKKLPVARRDATVTENTITAEFAGKRETYTYETDAAKSPPHIKLTRTADGKTETNHGIYKVEDGVLTVCATEADRPEARPTEFKTGRDVYLMVIRKRHELEGTYTLVGMAARGLTLTEADLDKVPAAERRLVIDEDEVILMFNGKDERGTFAFDKSKTPHRVDLGLTRDGKAETSPGIYTFDKGVLTICAGTGGARPTAIKPADNATVFTLAKQPRK